jgi:Flp pilus assembly protein TadD
MFPADPLANLNAANAAMRRGDNEAATRYLTKAGDSAEAVYARAALEVRKKNYEAAKTLLRKAQSMGVSQAAETLQQLP